MPEGNKKIIRISTYLLVFVGTFLVFLFLTFPFGVFKEALSALISKQTGINLRIGELSPHIPFGLKGRALEIGIDTSAARLKIDRLQVDVSLLRLLIGKLAAEVELTSESKGELELIAHLNLFDLLLRKDFVPSYISLAADHYPVTSAFDFMLTALASGKNMNPMVAPLLEKIKIKGDLSSQTHFEINKTNLAQSVGQVDIALKNSSFALNDPALNIAEQIFDKAQVKGNVVNGSLSFSQSGLQTQELDFQLIGNIDLKNNWAASELKLKMDIKLQEGLKENFGYLVDLMTGGSGGAASFQLVGTIAQPTGQKL